MTTVFNSGSGNWDDESTWLGGKVPRPLDDVALSFFDPSKPNQTYQVDVLDAEINNLTILDGNVLSVGTSLSVNLLLMAQNSALVGGEDVRNVYTTEGVQNNGTINGSFFFQAVGDEVLSFINRGTLLTSFYLGVDPNTFNVRNFGIVKAEPGTSMLLAVTINTGVIYCDAAQLQIGGILSNAGTVEVHGGGSLALFGGVENTPDSQLIIDSSIMYVFSIMTGGSAVISNDGQLNVNGSPTQQSTTSIYFQGAGSFWLDNSHNYSGTINGFGVGDWLALTDVSFVPDRDFYDPQSGFLVVDDGEHTAEIRISGTYAADDFVFREHEDMPDFPAFVMVGFNRLGSSAPVTVDASDLQLASLYMGYFGRAGDAGGKDYWHDQLTAGFGNPGALAAIAASFSVQAEAKAAYPLLADPQHATQAEISAFIGSVYDNLFGRAPDVPGLAYWQGQLNANAGSPQGIGAFILDVISGAQALDAATIANRAEAAAFFSDHLGLVQLAYDAAADAMARTALDSITHDHATVIAAEKAMSDFIDDQQLMQFAGMVISP